MTPTIPPDVLSQAFANPIVYVLIIMFLASYLIAEITGKLSGPLNKLLVRRRAASKRTEDQPTEIASLRMQVAGLVGDVQRLQGDLQHQGRRLDEAQQREEFRDNLAAAHRRWDVAVVNKLIDLGVTDMPDPPPLHVHPDYNNRETP